MSRIGKRIINIPEKTDIKIINNEITIKGPLGELNFKFSPLISVIKKENSIFISRANEEKHTKQLHGTTNSIIFNLIEGVNKGFKKIIEIKGVGYRAKLSTNIIEILAGYSHPIFLEVPNDIKVELPSQNEIIVSGIDKQKVGHFASLIVAIRKPNPYSGKGIMYKGQFIRRKEGKKASK